MTSHLGIYSPGLTTPFNTKTLTLECPEGVEMKMIQSDHYDDVLIFFFFTPDVRHVASSPKDSPGFEVRNRELYSASFLGQVLAQSSILASRSPTHQVI